MNRVEKAERKNQRRAKPNARKPGSSRKVFVHLFRNRIEVASPGYPPKPLTLAKLRRHERTCHPGHRSPAQ